MLYRPIGTNMGLKRGIDMTIKRSIAFLGLILTATALSGCLLIYEGSDSVCPGGDPNADNWPYCGSARPGGSQPGDDEPVY